MNDVVVCVCVCEENGGKSGGREGRQRHSEALTQTTTSQDFKIAVYRHYETYMFNIHDHIRHLNYLDVILFYGL